MATNTAADKRVKDELLDELASFLYDVYTHKKDVADDIIIEVNEGQVAENENETDKWYFTVISWRIFGFPQACPRYAN